MSITRPHRVAELRRKLLGLQQEFTRWEDQSKEGYTLRKHNSQIRRVTTTLKEATSIIEGELRVAAATAGTQPGLVIERKILDIHRIWEFFRSKLAQRYVPWLRPYLVAADDFACACYLPARAAAGDDRREPPLVFLNGGWSPYAVGRGSSYQVERVPEGTLVVPELRALLRSLPVSVIGVPWFQVQHLPDVVAVAHEVGHTVENDFGLGVRLRTVLGSGVAGQIPNERQTAWLAWTSEIFADLYGVLAVGPAFAEHLIDFLPVLPDNFQRVPKGPPWGLYPSGPLRARLITEVLRACGFAQCAQRLDELLAPTTESSGFFDDAALVVRALLEANFPELGGQRLKEVLWFTHDNQEKAMETAELISAGRDPKRTAIRELIAGARVAFISNPNVYDSEDANGRLLAWIETNQTHFVRHGKELDDVTPIDREAGRRLVATLDKLIAADRPDAHGGHET